MHRFSLEKYKTKNSRYKCLGCGKREFARYVDRVYNSYLADDVGKCNRLLNCGYHKTPKDFFKEVKLSDYKPLEFIDKDDEEPVSYCTPSQLEVTFQSEDKRCNLYNFLIKRFNREKVDSVFEKYYLGTGNTWNCSTIFWQIDHLFKIRCAKEMFYNSETGKRSKDKFQRGKTKRQWSDKTMSFRVTSFEKQSKNRNSRIRKNCTDCRFVF